MTTSLFIATRRLKPGSPLPWAVLGVGLAASTFVGIARVEAGKHFPSDVIGASAIGGALGVLIPAVHKSPVKVVPVTGDGSRQLAITGMF
jgi:membrane-associated phospholipid phosphatase